MSDRFASLEGNVSESGEPTVKKAFDAADSAADSAAESAPYETFARAGYAAKGVVYVLIGVLAALAAFSPGSNGQTTGSDGALRVLEQGPAGTALLALLALGLVGYVLWRFVQAFLDPEDVGEDDWGWAKRALYFVSGVAYGLLAFTAVQMILGDGGGSGGNGTQSMTAKLLQQPFGPWLVGLVAAGIAFRGLSQIWKAYKADFFEKIRYSKEISAGTVRKIGQVGLSARGIVFLILAWFLFKAAMQSNPQQAKGLEGILDTLAASSQGPWLLGAAGVGLVAYGFFQFIKARYRVIE